MHWFLFILVMHTHSVGIVTEADGRPRQFDTAEACESLRSDINETWAAMGRHEGLDGDYILTCLQDPEAERQSTDGAVSAPKMHSVVPKGDPA